MQAGKKVLVVDCDPQANATVGLGYGSQSSGRNMYDVFLSGYADFPETKITEIIRTTPSGIDLAPSHLDLVGVDPYLYLMENRAEVLRNALGPVRGTYDFILVDTPPSMGQLVINGLVAADHVVVTLDSGSFAIDGIATLSTIFSDMKDDLGREIKPELAIITRFGEGPHPKPEVPQEKPDIFTTLRNLFYKKPEPTEDEIRAQKEQQIEQDRLETLDAEIRRLFPSVYTVPYSPQIYEAQKRGLPISRYAPDCSAGAAYKTIADVIITWT